MEFLDLSEMGAITLSMRACSTLFGAQYNSVAPLLRTGQHSRENRCGLI